MRKRGHQRAEKGKGKEAKREERKSRRTKRKRRKREKYESTNIKQFLAQTEQKRLFIMRSKKTLK